MAQPRLQVCYGPEEGYADAPVRTRQGVRDTVTVSLGEIFPVLADATETRRVWLQDFEDDEITISSDLYEVILAYQHYCRPAA